MNRNDEYFEPGRRSPIPWKRGGAQPNPELPEYDRRIVVYRRFPDDNRQFIDLEVIHKPIRGIGDNTLLWSTTIWWCYESELLETLPHDA